MKYLIALLFIFSVNMVEAFADEGFQIPPQSIICIIDREDASKFEKNSYIYFLKTTLEVVQRREVRKDQGPYGTYEGNSFKQKSQTVTEQLMAVAERLKAAGVCSVIVNNLE